EAQHGAATARLDQARGHAQRQLVGIGNAVGAGKALAREQTLEIQIGNGSVEQRDVALVFVTLVQVEEPRLQRLYPAVVELALEAQPAAEGKHGDAAVDGFTANCGSAERLVVEVVMGVA